MPNKVWGEITCPFPDFNGCIIEVWEWINNLITHIMMDVITYPCCLQFCPYCYDMFRADSRFVPSQWETTLLCNNVSHWLSASLESTLHAVMCGNLHVVMCGNLHVVRCGRVKPSYMILTHWPLKDPEWNFQYDSVFMQINVHSSMLDKNAIWLSE